MMKRNEVLKELNEIFCRVFDDNDIIVTESTTADDIEDWDSLEHMNLLMAIEKKFGIKFHLQDVSKMKDVGDMLNAILERS